MLTLRSPNAKFLDHLSLHLLANIDIDGSRGSNTLDLRIDITLLDITLAGRRFIGILP